MIVFNKLYTPSSSVAQWGQNKLTCLFKENKTMTKLTPLHLFSPLDEFLTMFDSYCGYPVRVDDGFPRAEMKADENGITIEFALAGYSKDQLHVEITDKFIKVSGDKTKDSKSLFANRAFTWKRQDTYNQFDLQTAKCTFEDGLLRIRILRMEEFQGAKELEIK